jgi:hypothetical protein
VRESTYDRVLMAAALLAPFALIVLSKWRSSLETSYAHIEPNMAQVFGESFERKAHAWLQSEGAGGARLVLVTDRDCPCTRATRAALDAALASAPRRDVSLVERDIHDEVSDPSWGALLGELPATPTLLAIDQGQLVYAGPVNAGSWCTTSVSQVLGITALQVPGSGAVLNWLGEGCYCQMPGR